MIVLGIDPGYAIVGWGVVRYERGRFAPLDYGAVLTPGGNGLFPPARDHI